MNVSIGTSTHDGEQLCQIIFKSIHNCRGYGQDKIGQMDVCTPNCDCDKYVLLTASRLYKNSSENIVGKGENAGNQYFLLLTQYVLTNGTQNSSTEMHLICCLQMLSISTSLKFHCFVKELKLFLLFQQYFKRLYAKEPLIHYQTIIFQTEIQIETNCR